jgi:hypothetical protein
VKVAECRLQCYAAPLVFDCQAMRASLSRAEDGPVGLAGCGLRQRRPPISVIVQ